MMVPGLLAGAWRGRRRRGRASRRAGARPRRRLPGGLRRGSPARGTRLGRDPLAGAVLAGAVLAGAARRAAACRARRRTGRRCAATRTAPGLRPTSCATAWLSSPATTRSVITSAWNLGSEEMMLIAASVPSFSSTRSAGSTLPGPATSGSSGTETIERRDRRRPSSIARRRAVVNSQARQAASSPRKASRLRATWTQVSAATSSAASAAITRRYRSRAGFASRQSTENAPSASPVPPCAAASRRSNLSPITIPSIGTKCTDPQRIGDLCLNSPRNGGSNWPGWAAPGGGAATTGRRYPRSTRPGSGPGIPAWRPRSARH